MTESQQLEFIVFGSPLIEQAELDEVLDSLRSGWLGMGPKVAQFEQDFRVYKGGWGFPVAVNSCTAALHLSLIALGIGQGDEVITTPLTFCATVNAILHAGGTPVLADIHPQTLNIDPAEIRRRITPRTRALIPVHFAGRPCEMDAICRLAQQHHLRIVEDCAHSIEATYQGQPIGTFGDFACFSFYATKNIVTGEGGMILARDEGLANQAKTLALHGMSKDAWKRFSDDGYKHYQVVACGFKYTMMDLQAAIGIHQLRRIDAYWERRREIWQRYDTEFAALPISLPHQPEMNSRHAYHLYTIRIDQQRVGVSRDDFLDAMTRQRIGVGVHYMSIPEHPYYQNQFGWQPEEWPAAMHVGRQTVSLPISARLTDDEVSRVIDGVQLALKPR